MWTKNGCGPSAVGTAKYTGNAKSLPFTTTRNVSFSSVALPAQKLSAMPGSASQTNDSGAFGKQPYSSRCKSSASPRAILNSAHSSFSVHPKTYKRPLYAVIVAVLLGVCQSSKPTKKLPSLCQRRQLLFCFYRRFTRFPLRARTGCCRGLRRSRFLRAILHACPAPRCRRPSCRG